MKKSKIFMVAGTAVLAISAMFASKANKKFTTLSTVMIKGSATEVFVTANGTTALTNLLTTKNNGTNNLATARGALISATGVRTWGTVYTKNGVVKLYHL